MNLENILIGHTYKNYIELCSALEIKPTGGKQKENTLNNLKRYFKLAREGRTIKIIEALDKPIDKIDKRGLLWIYDCEIVLLDYLVRKIEKAGKVYSVALSKEEICLLIGLCSKTFYIERGITNKAENTMLASTAFFDQTYVKMRDVVRDVNRSLKSRSIIHMYDTYTYRDMEGVHIASPEMAAKIIAMYGICLKDKEIACPHLYAVVRKKKMIPFYNKLRTMLVQELGIRAVKPKICYSFDANILDRLDEIKKSVEQITQHRVNTNSKMLDFIEQKFLDFESAVHRVGLSVAESEEMQIQEYRRLIEECIKLKEETKDEN